MGGTGSRRPTAQETTRCPRSSHGDVGATEEDQGSPRAGLPGRGRDGRPRRAAGEPRARRASRAAGTEAGRGPVRSGCPRRSAPAALRAGDFRAGRGAQGAPGAGLGERARVPGVPLPCPARAFTEPRVGHALARGSPGSRGEGSLFLLQGTRRPERATSERTSCGAARPVRRGAKRLLWGDGKGVARSARLGRAARCTPSPAAASSRTLAGTLAGGPQLGRGGAGASVPGHTAATGAEPAGSAARHAGRARGRPRQESGGSRAPKGCCEPDHGPRQPAVARPSRAGPWPLGAPRVTARPFVPSTRHLRERSPRSAAAAFAACLDGVGRNDEPPAGLRIYVCPLDTA